MSKIIYLVIQVLRIQLARHAFIIFAQLILIFNFILCINAFEVNDDDSDKSPFSVLDEDVYELNTNLDITKQSIIQGELQSFNLAKIRILDYNTGDSLDKEIKIEEKLQLVDQVFINLKECKKDSKDILNPVSMAFITIIKDDELKFEGWIFSNNTSISLPKVDDKFVYLTSCDNQIIDKEEVSE